MLTTPIILASQSSSRLQLLRSAGLKVKAVPAHVDEAAVKQAMMQEGCDAVAVAMKLAELKAAKVARQYPNDLVLGADQMLILPSQELPHDNAATMAVGQGERWFDKPTNMAAAHHQLMALQGRTHILVTAAILFRRGQAAARFLERPHLTMRALTPAAVDDYLAVAGEDVLSSVGAYRLEGPGIQLFRAIDGDYFSILGLPLGPLLNHLYQAG